MREIVVQNHGRPGHEMSPQLIGPRDCIIVTDLIPASAFPADDTFGEGHLPNGVEYEVELLGDGVWDVWLNPPPDPWLDLLSGLCAALERDELGIAAGSRVAWRLDSRPPCSNP